MRNQFRIFNFLLLTKSLEGSDVNLLELSVTSVRFSMASKTPLGRLERRLLEIINCDREERVENDSVPYPIREPTSSCDRVSKRPIFIGSAEGVEEGPGEVWRSQTLVMHNSFENIPSRIKAFELEKQ